MLELSRRRADGRVVNTMAPSYKMTECPNLKKTATEFSSSSLVRVSNWFFVFSALFFSASLDIYIYIFSSYLTSICNRMVMLDLSHFPPSYQRQVKRPLSFLHFRAVSPPLLPRYRSTFGLTALLNQSFITKNYLLSSSSSPAWSALCSHSATLSVSPPRPLVLLPSSIQAAVFTACLV